MRKIQGKYRVVKSLGEGFGGSVFLVESDSGPLALKQLRLLADHEVLSSDEILDNFKQEFSTLKKLNHPNILRIVDFGYEEEDEFYYFTTEYIAGKDILEATRGLNPGQIEELMVQAFRALGYLHSQGIFHFDIKPSNILVGEDGTGNPVVKLIDFGLTAFHKSGILAGSPPFLAPEALLQERRDGRSDLYSLGVTWYTCLAGKNPFDAANLRETIDLHRVWIPPRISSQSAQIPPYLDPIMEKILRKNPAMRYHRADQVIRDLNWSGRKNYPLETEATALAYLPGEGRLVGREEEWGQILGLFDRVFLLRAETKVCLILSGESGAGKSRLLNEIKYHAQLQRIPVMEFSEFALHPPRSDALLLVDDAKPETFQLADAWLKHFSPHSSLLVMACRTPEEIPLLSRRLLVKPFNRPQVSEYIASVLGMERPPEFLIEELFKRTEGNPMLLTQWLEVLIGSHQIFDKQGRWSPRMLKELGVDFSHLEVPSSSSEYFLDKIHKLPFGHRQALAAIALSLRPLNLTALAQLIPSMERIDWKRLQKENFILQHPMSGEFHLLNPTLMDLAPRSISEEEVANLHQSLGEYWSQFSECPEVSWHHLGWGTAPETDRFNFLKRYGDFQIEKSQWLQAAKTFDRASQLSLGPEHYVEVSLKKAHVLFKAGNHDKALKLLDSTHEVLKSHREKSQHWNWVHQTYREMVNIFLKEHRLDLAREALQACRVLLEEHEENPVEEMILDNFKASLLFREGKVAEAESLSSRAYHLWLGMKPDQRRRVLNNELPSIYVAQNKHSEAKALFQEQAQFFMEIGHSTKRAHALYGLAESCVALKQFDEASKNYHECVELSRKTKNEELLFHAFNGLGNIAFYQKDWGRSAEYYQEALELAQHHSNIDGAVAIAINLALVFRFQSDFGSALLYLHHVIDTLEIQVPPSLHQLHFLLHAYLDLGNLKLQLNQFIEARDAYRDAARLVRSHPPLERFRSSAGLGLARTAIHLDRIAEAQTVLTDLEKTQLAPEERALLEQIQANLHNPPKGLANF